METIFDIRLIRIRGRTKLEELRLTLSSVLSFLVQVGIGETAKNNRFGLKIGTIIEGP